MAIMAKAGASSGPPAPAGTHAAICVDVVDLGLITSDYAGKEKTQHKIYISWQIDEDRQDGKPFLVSKRYTLSLHEKAGLRKDLQAWRGREFTQEELAGFDVESVIGAPALLSVIHNTKDGQTYANVNSIMKLPKSMVSPSIRDYIRVCDRQEAAPGESHNQPFGPIEDDDSLNVPF